MNSLSISMKRVTILTIDDLLKRVKNSDDIPEIKRAYEFANEKLGNQMRKNGDTVLSHCLEVANILIDLNVDNTTIISSILHELLDYTNVPIEEIDHEFGHDVAKIIESITKTT